MMMMYLVYFCLFLLFENVMGALRVSSADVHELMSGCVQCSGLLSLAVV